MKTLLRILCAVALLALLAACGRGDTGTPAVVADDDPPAAATEDAPAADEQEVAAEPDELSIIRIMGRDVAINLDGGQTRLSDWVYGESRMWDQLTSDLAERGIQLETHLVAEDQYDLVIQTQLAAGFEHCLTNISPIDNRTRMRLAEQGRILPINEIWERYSDGTATAFFNGPAAFSVDLTALENGNVYWLTDVQTSHFRGQEIGSILGFTIRQDWLNALDMPIPASTDELFDTLVAFQDNDMSGSGVRDEVISVYLHRFNTGIGQWFGFGTDIFYTCDATNTVRSPWFHENIQHYIRFMQSLVEAGLVDTSDQQSVKLAENQIAGLYTWGTGTWLEPQVQVPAGAPSAYFRPFLAQASDIDAPPFAVIQRGAQINTRGIAVTHVAQDLPAIARFLDYITHPDFQIFSENGIEGFTFEFDEFGEIVQFREGCMEVQVMALGVAQWSNNRIFPRYQLGINMEDARDRMYEIGMPGRWHFAYQVYNHPWQTGHDAAADLAVQTEAEAIRFEEIWTDLRTYSEETLTRLILGQLSLDDWDSFIDDLVRLGLEELLEIQQARLNRARRLG